MKNCSYNLVRVLSEKCRLQWKYKQYADDCGVNGCKECSILWDKLKSDEEKHIEMLRERIVKKCKADDF